MDSVNSTKTVMNTMLFKYAIIALGVIGCMIALLQALSNIIAREQDRKQKMTDGDIPFPIDFNTVLAVSGVINALVFLLLIIFAFIINPNRFKGFYNILNLSSVIIAVILCIVTLVQFGINLFNQRGGFHTFMVYASLLMPIFAFGMAFLFVFAMGGFGQVVNSVKQLSSNLGVYNKIFGRRNS